MSLVSSADIYTRPHLVRFAYSRVMGVSDSPGKKKGFEERLRRRSFLF